MTLEFIAATIVLGLVGTFLGVLLLPEFQKWAAAIRRGIAAILHKPFQSFAVVCLTAILVCVIKLAFLQG